MKASLLLKSSLFKKTFGATLLAVGLPVAAFWLTRSDQFQTDNQAFAIAGLALTSVLAAALAAYYLGKQVVEPLDGFIQTATQIARGEFFKQFSEAPRNEIGRLARLLNYIVEDLRINKKRKVSERLREKYKTQKILENISDGVILTDSESRISLMNSIAKQWFGVYSTAVEDESTGHMLKHPDLVNFIKAYSCEFAGKSGNTEIVLPNEDGWKEKVLKVTTTQIPSADNHELGFVVTVLRDITREKEVDRLKTELVSMVAHELRSPLTCISGFSELLLDDAITRDQSQEYATIILKESNRLNDLINKFLDISKIEAGKSQLRRTPVDMRMLVQKVLDFNMQLADKKNIAVTFEAPDEVSKLNLDRDMIEQAILNLFSNAVKYSPENSSVQLRLCENGEAMIVEVEDKGFGISEEALSHIFEKFYRVTDNEESRETSGTGLGLPLVKEIAEVHGGRINVCSKVGQGSTFTLRIPKKEDEPRSGQGLLAESAS